MKILAIESSCDETGAAIVEVEELKEELNQNNKVKFKVLANMILSQAETHAKYGGVVPEIASRAHTESVCILCENALKTANVNIQEIDIISATYAPGLIGALLVGLNFAKALAYKNNKPFVPVNHIKGHIAAAYLDNNYNINPPFLAFAASGGHTSIMEVKDYISFKTIGATRDDAIGEAFDKVARAMGLNYPGGAEIERLANLGDNTAIKMPNAQVEGHELDFSFSGIKTHIINYINRLEQKNNGLSEKDKSDIAACFTRCVVNSACSRLKRAIEITHHKKLIAAGGVLANTHMREALKELCDDMGVELFIPKKKYCGDNAAMIAAQAYYEFRSGNVGGLSQNAYANVE